MFKCAACSIKLGQCNNRKIRREIAVNVEPPRAVIVGAGPAGLACAAEMRAAGIRSVILEKAGAVGAVWRRHYDRLHLHTDRGHSGLPGWPMPGSYPRYPSRAQVVEYLEDYASHFDLQPVFNATVTAIRREGAAWRVDAGEHTVSAPAVVVATGWADFPYQPHWPGMEIFTGRILHSSAYRNPEAFAGQHVLVVGFGNSGGEIALDLAEAGVDVAVAVRGPVQLLPRELFGLPILTWAIAQQHLPARVSDFINAPAIRLALGEVESLGLEKAAKGPRRMVEEDQRVPLLDIGTLKKIREGRIKIRKGIEYFTPAGVRFADSITEDFDAVILATGFRPDLRKLLPDVAGVFGEGGKFLMKGPETSEPGLYFCGLVVAATGQFREIGLHARRIAAMVKGSEAAMMAGG
jgi:cation diffusion facilitator CzcD-associated flavoprotein CzcO